MTSIQDLPVWVRDNQAYKINLDHGVDSATGVQKTKPVKANVGGSANVISSEMLNVSGFDLKTPTHSVMLDLDIRHKLIPSSTPGHSHLYLDTELSHNQYKALLEALWEAGIIQRGILDQFEEHGATFLRLPGVKKKPSEPLPF